MSEWIAYTLGEVTTSFDSVRVPVKSTERIPGPYPYYGASGVVDHVSDYLLDGEYLLISEDGENLRTRKTPVAFMATGKFWVNNHAHVARGNNLANTHFLCYLLAVTDISGYISGSTQPKLTQASLNSVKLKLPGRRQQDAIVEVLGALDDKIAVNERIAATADNLMLAHLEESTYRSAVDVPLSEVAVFHNKKRIPLSSRERSEVQGPYPYYGAAGVIDHVKEYLFSGPHVLVGEDGTVVTSEGRPVVQYVWGDFWVNNHAHVLTGTAISSELLAISLRFTNVASLVTGAVQPKLNMRNLQRLSLRIPHEDHRHRVERLIARLWETVRLRRDETRTLVALRDTLLPQLMSGRLRVKDAEKIVEDHT
ncbi:restriction endonuclease subunit S [Streptomyces mirabilis]|uniref:restriction endonuclease subunit S n=1 Tax=Streptomyces mirabilis TaxID=68239 RepID=UPI0036C001F3